VHQDRSQRTTKKHLARPTAIYSQSRGRSRHPGNRGGSLSRTASPKVKSAQRGSNAARASSARSPEVVAGLTRSFRARSPMFNRSPPVKNVACARST
jgi:hypothetical protein